jgi:hypothetical protein
MKFKVLFLILFIGFVSSGQAKMITGTDESANLPFWEWNNGTMSVRFVQRLPDQTRGYFMARGFKQFDAEILANSCVFQVIYKNIGALSNSKVIKYQVSNWRIAHNNKFKKVKLKDEWLIEWNKKGIVKSAIIAFEWSLLPSRQDLQPGDYNWGMMTFNLPFGAKFDLDLIWQEGFSRQVGHLSGITCANDIHPDPTSN